MENMNLTSLQDHSDYLETLDIPDAEKWRLHCQRKSFGKQPLSLSMFVPTSETGEVLNEPEMYMALQNVGSMNSYATEQECIDAENYHMAKNRVLFEGFKHGECDEGGFVESNDCVVFIKYFWESSIESLLTEGNVTLTKKAINQIFK